MNTRTADSSARLGPHLYRWITVLSKVMLWWLWSPFPHFSIAVFVAPELWLVYHTLVPNASGLGPVRRRFPARNRDVWLTIDDGPDPRTTPVLLDLLDTHGAKAIFFVIGEKARRHPELVRMIADRGHVLGNHTDSHPLGFFWCSGRGRTEREIDACTASIVAAAGIRPAFFRSPAGINLKSAVEAVA